MTKCGIQTSYINAAGKKITASRQTLEALTDTLGTPPKQEPVIVQWDGKPKRIALQGAAELRLESGEVLAVKGSTLPGSPFGYHRLYVKGREVLVISAPAKSYSDPEAGRSWGIFAPMYALRSRTEGFGEWQNLVDWLQPFGATVVATLPLLASFPWEPSPYSPSSRLFWNEFYVDMEVPPQSSGLLNYERIATAKRAKLQAEAEAFFRKGGSAAFDRYRAAKPRLDDYAAFQASKENDKRAQNYYAYVQWRAQQQMDELLRHCRSKGMKFYLDLPLGVHPDGYDVWRERESFALDVNAGSPPDPLFTNGQDWGFSPLNPHGLRQTHYRYLLEFLRFQMQHTGLLRIDHVMWLHRLYWIPKGRPASEGAYVRYPAEELYAILCLESHRHQTMLVGENLGTVPPEVNEAMARHQLRETYVLQYEAGARLRQPPRRSVASLNTHDMPTFEAFLRGLDIDDRFDLGLIKKSNLAAEKRRRQELVKALGARGKLESALEWLARSDAETVLINIEDLWRETLPQNVPGTSSERPNWRRKLRYPIAELRKNRPVQRLLRLVAAARGQSQPTGSSGRGPRKRANVLAHR